MTDPNNPRLNSLISQKIIKAAADLGITNIDAFVSEMLVTHVKVSETFPDSATRQQQLDELLQTQEVIEKTYSHIVQDMADVGHPLTLTQLAYVDQSCELYRFAASAALEGKRLGFMEDLPEEGFVFLAPSLEEAYEDVLYQREKTLRSRVAKQGSHVAGNANTLTEIA